MLTHIKNYFDERSGVAAVEFALVAPVLIFLLIGAADIGFYMIEHMKLQNTAHGVAEFIAREQNDEDANLIADELYAGDFNEVSMSTSFSCECSNGVVQQCPVSCGSGDYQRRFTTVLLERNFSPIFPYPGLADSLQLRGGARMRVD